MLKTRSEAVLPRPWRDWHATCIGLGAVGAGTVPANRPTPLCTVPSMRSLLAGFSLSIALLVPVVASAATVYEVNTTGATQTGSKNNDVYIGQAFESGTNTLLTSADLQINSNALASGTFVLNLQLTTGSPGAYFASGSPLVSATFSNTILSTTLGSFYSFTNLN